MPCQGAVHLRRAVAADAAGIASVYLAAWQKAHEGLVPAEYAACLRQRAHEDSWRDELTMAAPHSAPWVALIDDRLVGVASGGLSRDEDAVTGDGEVYQIHVEPECWRRGIGSSLLRHVLRDLHERHFERAHIWVVRGSAPVTAFIGHHGWKPDGATRFDDCGGAQVEEIRYRHALR